MKEKVIKHFKYNDYVNRNEDIRKRELNEKTKRYFYSLCRKVNDFSDVILTDEINILIEELKNRYGLSKDEIFIMKILNSKMLENKVTPTEAMFIFINVVDPELNVLESHKINSKIEKLEIDNKALVLVELNYLRTIKNDVNKKEFK